MKTTLRLLALTLFLLPFTSKAQFNIPLSWTGGTGPNNSEICGTDMLTITADTIVPGLTYEWYAKDSSDCASTSWVMLASGVPSVNVNQTAWVFCYAIDSNDVLQGTSPELAVFNVDANDSICSTGPTTNLCYNDIAVLQVQNEIWQELIDLSGTGVVQWQMNGVDIPGANAMDYLADTAGIYRVRFTSSCGSAYSNAITVSYWVNSPGYITGDLTICQGLTTTLTASPGLSYLWSNGAITPTITVNSSGTYTVTINNGGGCTQTVSALVIVNANPAPNITGITIVCSGSCATLNAGPGYVNYIWSTGNSTPTLQACLSGNYTVTVTDSNGCSGTDSVTVNVNPNPAPVITGNTDICPGSCTTLNSGAGLANYLWSTGDMSQTIVVCNAGVYTVTVTNAFGCSGTTSIAVSVFPQVTPQITGDSTFCTGTTATLDAGSGFLSYLWSTSATTQTIVVAANGSYWVTVTDANGCTSTDSIQVTGPAATISGSTTICAGFSIDLPVSFTGAAPFTYSYSNGTQQFGPFVTISNPTMITVSPSTNTVYTLIDYSDANCTGTVSGFASITIIPGITPVITGNTTICQGSCTTLDANFPGYFYQWNTGATTETISACTAGTYTVTVSDGLGCSGTDTITVTSIPAPMPQITTADSTLCQGQTTVLDAGPGGVTYMWNTGSTAQTITISSLNIYTVTVTGANGCTGTDNIMIGSQPPYSTLLGASGPLGICIGDSVQLLAPTPMVFYQWYRNNTPIPGATSPTLWAAVAGRYNCLSLDTSGCAATSNTVKVAVVCFPPLPPSEKIIETPLSDLMVTVFPNPSAGDFTVRFNHEIQREVEISVTDLTGKIVWRQISLVRDSELVLPKQLPGYYLLEIQTREGIRLKKSFIAL